MEKNKHLDLESRIRIEIGLNNRLSFKAIGMDIGKDCTTVSKEVRARSVFKRIGSHHYSFNNCAKRKTCKTISPCPDCVKPKRIHCAACGRCILHCSEYVREDCPRLRKPPYVCNGCPDYARCTLEKCFYSAKNAQALYSLTLSESRSGINASEDEIKQLDGIVSPLLKNGQSIHSICTNNADSVTVCEKTLYRYTNSGLFAARNIDLPRKVRFRPRKSKPQEPKVDKACRIGRTYEDFLTFMKQNPSLPVVELDTVEGIKGGAVLLTVHFVAQKFQLAFRRDANTSKSVTDIFLEIRKKLGTETYTKLFRVMLCDNGTEFSNPSALEFDENGNRISHIFYCHQSSPFEKGACENNHEMIRRVIPKGTDITPFSQEQISLMMSHINSYVRPDLGDKTPFALFGFCYGSSVPGFLGIRYILPNDVILKPSLLPVNSDSIE